MIYYKFFSRFYEKAARKMCIDCQDFIKENSKILDLGCGSGIVGEEFQKFFKADIIGVDIKDLRIKKIPFKSFDGLNLPFLDNSFDTVLISYVLHHARDPEFLLKEAKRVVKNRIIIYEDLPEGFLAKLFCYFHGISFGLFFQKNKESGTFKNDVEWKEIFGNLGLRLTFEKKVSPVFYSVKQKLFILEKI